ncbi:MAG: hypothetical protein LLG44_10105 [Chloroflexi bacterium]|nr:hypothetical protein [Chloroflexota bacterium]
MKRPTQYKRIGSTIIMLLAVLVLAASGYGVPHAAAQGANHASLIVVFGPGDVFSSCVTFTESEISGIELAERAGLTLVSQQVAGVGEAVCKIEEIGCNYPGEQCFCKCLGTPCNYWSYWIWEGGAWVYAGRGAGQNMVKSGDINAWVWGDGQSEPPAVTAGGVCDGAGLQQSATNTPQQPTVDYGYNPYPEGTQAAGEPSSVPADAATPEPSLTPEGYPGATIAEPTATSESDLSRMTLQPGAAASATAQQGTAAPTMQQQAATAAAAQATSTPLAQVATATPDRSASIVARAASAAAATGTPQVAPEAAEKRSYWAFLGITLVLVIGIGYVLLLRRQRARNKQE